MASLRAGTDSSFPVRLQHTRLCLDCPSMKKSLESRDPFIVAFYLPWQSWIQEHQVTGISLPGPTLQRGLIKPASFGCFVPLVLR